MIPLLILMVLCYSRLYRTVSYLPATVISGWPPLKYALTIRALGYAMKKNTTLLGDTLLTLPRTARRSWPEARHWLEEEAVRLWNAEWSEFTKGEWTRRLFPVARVHRNPPCFMMGMAFTGHGSFRNYLHRIQRAPDLACECGEEIEDAQHIFTECCLYADGRPAQLNVEEPDTRRYLLETMRALWDEEEERRRADVPE